NLADCTGDVRRRARRALGGLLLVLAARLLALPPALRLRRSVGLRRCLLGGLRLRHGWRIGARKCIFKLLFQVAFALLLHLVLLRLARLGALLRVGGSLRHHGLLATA